MQDLLLTVAVLCASSVIGYPACLLLPATRFQSRFVAAPALGFAALSAAIIVSYQLGVSPRVVLIALCAIGLGVSAAHLVRRRPAWPPTTDTRATGTVIAAVVLLCVLPAWIGGPQFTVFQGNGIDQMNVYLPGSASFHRFDYARIAEARSSEAVNPIMSGARFAMNRPVSLVHAAFAGITHATTASSGYAFTLALQINMFFSALFVALNVFGARHRTAILAAMALTIGFFQQYVLDINAWTQLATQALYLWIVGIVVLAFDPGRFGERPAPAIARLAVLFGLAMTAALLLYPDSCSIAGTAGAAAIVAALLARRSRQAAIVGFAGLGLATAVALVASYAFGPLRFFFTRMTVHAFSDVNWWKYFQRYLFGRKENYLEILSGDAPWPEYLNALISLPVESAVAGVGLYWFLPSSSWPLPFALMLKAVLYVFIVLLFAAAIRTMITAWRDDPASPGSRMLVACVAGCVVPVLFLVAGRYWTAGKAMSIASPLLFFFLAAPVLLRMRLRWLMQLACLSFIAGHLITGALRPVMARDAIGRSIPGVPRSAPEVEKQKAGMDWRLERWAAQFRACKGVILDIEQPYVAKFAQLVATDIGASWASMRPMRIGGASSYAFKPPGWQRFDCVASDHQSEWSSGRRLIWLVADRTVFDFLEARTGRLELAGPYHPGLAVEGLAPFERSPRGPFRRTSRLARFKVANSPLAPAMDLVAELWPATAASGADVRITVNQRTAFEGPIPDGPIRMPLSHVAGEKSLTIELSVNQDPGQPERGVALRSLRLEKTAR